MRLRSIRQRSSSEALPSRNRCTLFSGKPAVLGDIMLDKLVVDNVKSEPLGKPGNNIFAERAHFARHCNNGHGDP